MLYKDNFPVFKHHKDLVYLDNAATSQKPSMVTEGMKSYYETANGSPHRGAHYLSVESTERYDQGRQAVRRFINSQDTESIVFTRNATEALNLIAYSFVEKNLTKEHNIVLSITNHHSNILPFQRICQKTGAELRYMYCDETGKIPKSEYDKIDEKTWMISIPYITNGLGVVHDVKSMFAKAEEVGAIKLLDAAQAVGHIPVDVQALNPDLLVFSGHKMFAPQGIGVLYGRLEILESFDPFLTGGDMIEYVEEQTSTFAPLPERLEAGTQNVAGVFGLTKAIEYIESIGLNEIEKIESDITTYALKALRDLDYVEVYGHDDRGAVITFNVKEVHPHDIASILDHHHVAIRAGHHCCQPLMHHLGLASTCRASFSIFNTKEDVHQLIKALEAVKDVFYE